jgi:hypothetical protein
MRIISLLFLAAFLVLPRDAVAAEGGHTHVHALLVIASNQRGASDARLSGYEPTLRSFLRFESYRFAGEASANLATPGKASASLGSGHSLELETEKSNGGGVRLRVDWRKGGRSLINSVLSLRPDVPAVLGGPSTGKEGEVWAVILIAD